MKMKKTVLFLLTGFLCAAVCAQVPYASPYAMFKSEQDTTTNKESSIKEVEVLIYQIDDTLSLIECVEYDKITYIAVFYGKDSTHTENLAPVKLVKWGVDPRPNPSISSYAGFANNPIAFTDPNGDTVKFIGMNTSQIESYEAKIKVLNESKLFKYYYEVVERSSNVYYFSLDESIGKGGQFNSMNNTITLLSLDNPAVLVQEWFHAFQTDLGVYSDKDHTVGETEGDLMTEYVANEAFFGLGGMLLEQGLEGGWAENILKINGDRYINPINKQIQSDEYNKLFNEAVDKRIEHFKGKGEEYKGYTTPNSGSEPKAIKEVFSKVYGNE